MHAYKLMHAWMHVDTYKKIVKYHIYEYAKYSIQHAAACICRSRE